MTSGYQACGIATISGVYFPTPHTSRRILRFARGAAGWTRRGRLFFALAARHRCPLIAGFLGDVGLAPLEKDPNAETATFTAIVSGVKSFFYFQHRCYWIQGISVISVL